MRFVHVIFRNLLLRKTRSLLTIAGLTLAVTAMIALLSVAWGFAASAATFYEARGVDIVVVRAGVTDRLTSSVRGSVAASLASTRGVAAIDGSLTEMISLGEGSLFGIPLRGLDPSGLTIGQLTITAGRALKPGDHGVTLVGVGIAESLNRRLGEQLDIEGTPFEIVGIFTTQNPLESNSVVAPLADVQALMDRPDQVTEFQIRAADSIRSEAAMRELCQQIENMRDEQQQTIGLKAQPVKQFVDNATETKLAQAMAWGTSAIVILLSLLGMLNTMLMSVLERTREFGILRAIGWKRGRVVRMILGESVLLSFMGGILGTAAAWVVVQGMSHWSVTRSLVSPQLSGIAIGLGVAAALIAGITGALYPAYRSAGIPVTEALRND